MVCLFLLPYIDTIYWSDFHPAVVVPFEGSSMQVDPPLPSMLILQLVRFLGGDDGYPSVLENDSVCHDVAVLSYTWMPVFPGCQVVCLPYAHAHQTWV